MKKTFTFFTTLLCALVFNFSLNAQCVDANTSLCEGTNVVADFSTGPMGFTSWDFGYYNNIEALRTGDLNTGATINLNTPEYYFFGASNVTVGFNLSGNGAAYLASGVIYVYKGNTIIGSCSFTATGGGTYCKTFGLSDHTSGMIHYRMSFTTGVVSANKTLIFDDFAVAGNAQAPLPVHFTGFEVKKVFGGALLTWNVDLEENVKVYEVEKSTDGRTFTAIGFVNASQAGSYQYTDNNLSGSSYYRIRSVDLDGKFMYSPVVALQGEKSAVVIKAFPSPVINELVVQHDAAEASARITVSSIDGKVISEVIPSKNSQQTTINLSSARPGIYLVRFENGSGVSETIKILKQ